MLPPRALQIIVGAFVAANLTALAWTGVHIGADTGRYTTGAAQLTAGAPLDAVQSVHIGYIVLIAIFQAAHLGLVGVVVFQILVAAASLVAVHGAARSLGGATAGVLAALVLAGDIDTNRWHSFVLTDSLFLSLQAIGVWWLYRATAGGRARGSMFGALLLFGGLALVRPESWIVAAAAVIYATGISRPSIVWLVLAAVAVLVVATALLAPVRTALDALLPVEPLRYGRTIWGYDGWTLAMPGNADGTPDPRGVVGALRYAAHHPVSASALMLARLAVHFAHVRPYYSIIHNAAIVCWLLLVYGFAWRGWRAVGRHPFAQWVAIVVLLDAAVVAITHADWDGRYLAHVLPLIYLLSACGAVRSFSPSSSEPITTV